MFIASVGEGAAEGDLAGYYRSQRAAWGFLPNYAAAFSTRPDVARAWYALNTTIRDGMDRRRFEIATIAAARARRSTYCTADGSSCVTAASAGGGGTRPPPPGPAPVRTGRERRHVRLPPSSRVPLRCSQRGRRSSGRVRGLVSIAVARGGASNPPAARVATRLSGQGCGRGRSRCRSRLCRRTGR